MSVGAKRFAWSEANLLPVTKFVSRGFLIKCLGQVDLLPAPLYIAPTDTRPAAAPAYPGFHRRYNGMLKFNGNNMCLFGAVVLYDTCIKWNNVWFYHFICDKFKK
ncbi:hypothetical protein K040078D81_39270 [Blautia hominis]|uniref:Uncharacterized protein n=1 Tax=Blautia hominis TaxID=2025493 RepID=A0ABQ0BEC2_9FIRM